MSVPTCPTDDPGSVAVARGIVVPLSQGNGRSVIQNCRRLLTRGASLKSHHGN